jgi:hypothetical protein
MRRRFVNAAPLPSIVAVPPGNGLATVRAGSYLSALNARCAEGRHDLPHLLLINGEVHASTVHADGQRQAIAVDAGAGSVAAGRMHSPGPVGSPPVPANSHQVYDPSLQPNASGACISGRPGTTWTIS